MKLTKIACVATASGLVSLASAERKKASEGASPKAVSKKSRAKQASHIPRDGSAAIDDAVYNLGQVLDDHPKQANRVVRYFDVIAEKAQKNFL